MRKSNILTIYRNNLRPLSINGIPNTIKSIPKPKVYNLTVPISVALCLFSILATRFTISGTLENSDIYPLRNFVWSCRCMYRGADKSLARPRKERSSEACQGHARFQQNRDASCHQVSFPARQGAEGNSCHYDRNHYLVSFLVELRTYQHHCNVVETPVRVLPGNSRLKFSRHALS